MLMSHTPNFNSYTNSHLSCIFVTSSPCTFESHVYAHVSCLVPLSCILVLHACLAPYNQPPFPPVLDVSHILTLHISTSCLRPCLAPHLACLSHLTINQKTICYTNLYHLSYMFVASSSAPFNLMPYNCHALSWMLVFCFKASLNTNPYLHVCCTFLFLHF